MNSKTQSFPELSEITSYLTYLKQECELRIMFKVSKPIISKIKKNCFSTPKLDFLASKMDDNISVSTADTDIKLEVETQNEVPPLPHPDYSTLISKSLENGHRKFKTLVKALKLFEERSLLTGAMNKQQLERFRMLCMKDLEVVAKEYEIFTHQHADSVILAFLFKIVDEIQLSKKLFLKNVSFACKKNCTKISTIKKSKSYAYLKKLLA